MDVLKPELLWINNRCYRLTPCNNLPQNPSVNKQQVQQKGYVEEDLYDDDEELSEKEIISKNGQFESSFHIPSMFYSHIIGAKGFTKKRIESETGTRILVPKQGTTGNIVVTGKSRNDVSSACRKLDLVVLASRSKIPSTHFISVPFNSKSIKDSYIKFKDDVISNNEIINLNENFFSKPEKLHLTINVLSLVDNEDRILAAEVLQECQQTFINSILKANDGEIYLHMKGLEIMNDDPSSVDILYGKVTCEAFQQIADYIMDAYCRSNLTQKRTDSVKLHVTLISSKSEQNDDTNKKARISFDARRILENYFDYDFGIIKLEEIHLSQRFSTSSDGYYEATTVLKL